MSTCFYADTSASNANLSCIPTFKVFTIQTSKKLKDIFQPGTTADEDCKVGLVEEELWPVESFKDNIERARG